MTRRKRVHLGRDATPRPIPSRRRRAPVALVVLAGVVAVVVLGAWLGWWSW